MKNPGGNIVVIGTTGSGKSTLARQIAAKTGRHAIDLDDCYWNPGWQPAGDEVFTARLQAALAAAGSDGWVVAGSYSRMRRLFWGQAQTVVALDYHPARIFWQLFCRTVNRSWTGKPVCNGNRETFAKSFLDRDSILIWFFKTFRRRQQEISTLVSNPGEYGHATILHFTHPKETAAWLKTL